MIARRAAAAAEEKWGGGREPAEPASLLSLARVERHVCSRGPRAEEKIPIPMMMSEGREARSERRLLRRKKRKSIVHLICSATGNLVQAYYYM